MKLLAAPSPEPTDPIVDALKGISEFVPGPLQPLYLLLLPVLIASVPAARKKVLGYSSSAVKAIWERRRKTNKALARKRAMFARGIAHELAHLSAQEEWRDDHFTEMEAELEIYSRPRRGLLRIRRRETIRRVRSLSRALEKSQDQVVMLEGAPGSGKSVALRHLAIRMANQVAENPSENGIIPIYVNLKEFRPEGNVDARAVEDWIKSAINKANDRQVERFVDEQFQLGIDEGTWLFLFDSFDEIPEVLGAIEADATINLYETAIHDFLTRMNQCRGIIATREFRGPRRTSGPKFRILNLTARQRKSLIDKLELPPDVEERVLDGLEVADDAIKQLAQNPLFLALLCEHQRDGNPFPRNSHSVFSNYVDKRFLDDAERIQRRFGLSVHEVRHVAEVASFCMSAAAALGLSPTRTALLKVMGEFNFRVDDRTRRCLDALEYGRLARSDSAVGAPDAIFTFAHRRFQEYFATCFVLTQPEKVSAKRLLTDGRWRETAVTLFQTQDDETVRQMVNQAEQILNEMLAELARQPAGSMTGQIIVPKGALHLLGLLQSAFAFNDERLNLTVRVKCSELISETFSKDQLHDHYRRWAVDVCSVADPDTAFGTLRQAFESGSAWLAEGAYAQLGRMTDVPMDLRKEIWRVLASLAAGGTLRKESRAVGVQIARLADPRPEQLLKRLYIWIPFVDFWIWAAFAASVIFSLERKSPVLIVATTCLCALAHLTLYVLRDTRRLRWNDRFSGNLGWFYASLSAIGLSQTKTSMLTLPLVLRLYLFIYCFILIYSGVAFLPTLFLALATVWAPTAIYADRILEKIGLARIIVLPVLALRKLVGMILPGRLTRRQVANGVGFLILAGLYFAVLDPLTRWLLETPGGTVVGFVFIGFFALAIGAAVIALIYVMVKGLSNRWRDHRLLHEIEFDKVSINGFKALLVVMGSFRTERGLLLFMESIKRNSLGTRDPAYLADLRALALVVRSLTGGVSEHVAVLVALSEREQSIFLEWFDIRQPASNRVLANHALAIRDEIGRIMADAEGHGELAV